MFQTLAKAVSAAAFALVASLAIPTEASAATVDFSLDLSASSITLTQEGGVVCDLSSCGLDVGFADSDFSADEGTTTQFDFLTFTGEGTGYLSYGIEVNLVFDGPEPFTLTASGSGSGLLLSGSIIGGTLMWDDSVPATFTLSDGSMVTIDFKDHAALTLGGTTTSSGFITVTPAPVPLPAGGLLLVGALGGLALLRRRKA
ncbi:VPLPA-CTERM sorting domain-containing protein [Frigidibacter oleivorans]|uniref:VPLPA-CTERM sorting domain-containing protein n=1 Tax=Frigidibacter oleivorans TaxID=2487129 RepID=UPI000F8E1426|nr:VPLPA-CTERM sorting domain-containing protein [Frigidibacter oleivorans]